MYKKAIVSVILSISLIITGCSSPVPKDRNELTEKQWEKDIDYMVKSIKKNHEDPFHGIKESDWMKDVDKLKKDLPNLSPVQISLRMNQLIAMLKDENTVIDYSTLVGQSREDMVVYPITFDWFNNNLYAIQGDESAIKSINSKLVSVNGQKIEDVISQINTLIPYENIEWSKVNNKVLITFPEVLKFFNIIEKDEVEFTFEKEDGSFLDVMLKPQKYKDIKYVADSSKAFREGTTQKMPKNSYGTYWFKYIPEKKTFYLQYNQGVFKDDIKSNQEVKLPKFKEFKNNLIDEVKKHDINKFVVDLRRDSSGNPERMKEIVAALKEETSIIKDSKVYGLIGYNTFGVGVNDAIILKEEANATLVGAETGGHTSGYGKPAGFRLPSSQIVLQSATKFVKINDYKGTLKPDVKVEQSYNAYLNGVDEVFGHVVEQKNR